MSLVDEEVGMPKIAYGSNVSVAYMTDDKSRNHSHKIKIRGRNINLANLGSTQRKKKIFYCMHILKPAMIICGSAATAAMRCGV